MNWDKNAKYYWIIKLNCVSFSERTFVVSLFISSNLIFISHQIKQEDAEDSVEVAEVAVEEVVEEEEDVEVVVEEEVDSEEEEEMMVSFLINWSNKFSQLVPFSF